ncbi:hypothetical protein C2G38_2212049 [Gigaspora rosea]|uniref:Uncharacterized protein n=1 Tax=Gigaspora rosea TaxID=44941 RepID=A0A397UD74_9GLOM|nr:hypothetical protein C2G38_2212049 [Gigaspora rosea]
MCDHLLNKERKKLEILQIKGIAQDTGQSQSYTFALNNSTLANLELSATKIYLAIHPYIDYFKSR